MLEQAGLPLRVFDPDELAADLNQRQQSQREVDEQVVDAVEDNNAFGGDDSDDDEHHSDDDDGTNERPCAQVASSLNAAQEQVIGMRLADAQRIEVLFQEDDDNANDEKRSAKQTEDGPNDSATAQPARRHSRATAQPGDRRGDARLRLARMP